MSHVVSLFMSSDVAGLVIFLTFCVFVCFDVILTAVPGGIKDHKSALRCEFLEQHEVKEQQINTSHEHQGARAAGRKYCKVHSVLMGNHERIWHRLQGQRGTGVTRRNRPTGM